MDEGCEVSRYPLRHAMERAALKRRFHMPGHFGQGHAPWLHRRLDLTEAEGLDALVMPEGVLLDVQRRLAAAYRAPHAWLSVQGATLPIMAGSLALMPPGSRVAVERHCHRSVMAAAVLGDWDVSWVTSDRDAEWDLWLPAPASAWPWSRVQGAVTVSPTFDGLVGDMAGTLEAAHRHDVHVLVDAAHGSHFGRSLLLPRHPLDLGADAVAHGLHKTEPVLTQTGLLLGAASVPTVLVDEWLRTLSTSSPSYLLMAGLEAYANERENGDGGWTDFAERIMTWWRTAEQRGYRILQAEWARRGNPADPAKLTIRGDGTQMVSRLRAAGMEPEMWSPGHVSLIVGPSHPGREDWWDDILDAIGAPGEPPDDVPPPPSSGPVYCRMSEARRRRWRTVPLREAQGLVAARALTPYPPGIPAAMPGEVLTAASIGWLEHAWRHGARVEGVSRSAHNNREDEGGPTVWVLAD